MHTIKGSEMYLSAMVSVKAEFADSRSILFECDFYSNLFSISTLYWFKESNMGTSVVARQILVLGSKSDEVHQEQVVQPNTQV